MPQPITPIVIRSDALGRALCPNTAAGAIAAAPVAAPVATKKSRRVN
jgi:hypothetical protein